MSNCHGLTYTRNLDNIKKKMWYDCQRDNYPQKTKMTQTLTTIGHRTAFNAYLYTGVKYIQDRKGNFRVKQWHENIKLMKS